MNYDKIINMMNNHFHLNLSEEEKTILSVMLEFSHHSDFDFFWIGYNDMEDETQIEAKRMKKIMTSLRSRDIVEHKPCMGYETEVCGSGNFITEKYMTFCEDALSNMKEDSE